MKLPLVEGWRSSWRWLSVRAAVVFGALSTYLMLAPETLVQVIGSLPAELRGWVPAFAGPILTALIVGLRLYRQGPKS